MKKLILTMIIACLAIGTASAQGWGGGWGVSPQTISVSGTLQLQNGVIAVASGNNTYFVPMLARYIGFIEGLREGAQISMDGFASGNYIQPTKVTIGGKSYDFSANVPQRAAYGGGYGSGCGRGMGYNGGWGGCW